MVNFIWRLARAVKVLAVPGGAPDLYGKEPRPGRKVGHANVVAGSEAELRERIGAIEALHG